MRSSRSVPAERRPRTPWRGAGVALGGAVAVSLAAGLAASAAESPPAGWFGERIDVRALDVEVVVEDARGRRVEGLTAADFELLVDGRPVAIDFFREVRGGAGMEAVPEAGEGVPVTAPGSASASADPVAAPGEPVPTHVLVVVDDFLTVLARDRDAVLRRIEEQLGVLGPEDLVAVVSFDGVQARLLAPWTASRPALAEGLRQAREASPQGFVFASTVDSEIGALRQEARELREEAQTASRRGTTMRQRTFGEMQSCTAIEVLEGKLERLVSGISAVLRSLPRPPGRRVALLLSGGWPRSVEKMLTSGGPILSGCDSRGAAIYQPLYETANLLGYTLYPVDVPLPSGGLVSAADADGIAEREDSDYVAATAMQSATVEGELHATLGRLALETGGRALLDGDSRHALERVAADTESYYWLGFSPDRQADDEDHRLEVRVLRPGLEARHRRGFRDLSVQAEVDHATEGLLLFDLPGGAVPLDLEVGPIPAGRRPVVPLRVSIPLAGVAFLPAGGALQAELELRIATLDEAGRRSDLARVPLVLRAATAPAAGERTVQEIPLRIRRGSQVLAVTLHDPASRVLMAGRVVIVP